MEDLPEVGKQNIRVSSVLVKLGHILSVADSAVDLLLHGLHYL